MRIALIYATNEGQTAKIAERINAALVEAGATVDVHSLPMLVGAFTPERYDAFILGASIHVGKHQAQAVEFARRHRDALTRIPSAFYSVSLTARFEDDPEQHALVEQYLAEFTQETGWQPDLVAAFAGALRYRQYNLIKRLLMRSISKKMGGDTDTSKDHEYTDWNAVEHFAAEFLKISKDARPII